MVAGWFCSLNHTGKFLFAMLFAGIWNFFTTQDKRRREATPGSQKKETGFQTRDSYSKKNKGKENIRMDLMMAHCFPNSGNYLALENVPRREDLSQRYYKSPRIYKSCSLWKFYTAAQSRPCLVIGRWQTGCEMTQKLKNTLILLKLGSHTVNTAPELKIKHRYYTGCEMLILDLEISGVTYFSIFLNEEHCLAVSLCRHLLLRG